MRAVLISLLLLVSGCTTVRTQLIPAAVPEASSYLVECAGRPLTAIPQGPLTTADRAAIAELLASFRSDSLSFRQCAVDWSSYYERLRASNDK